MWFDAVHTQHNAPPIDNRIFIYRLSFSPSPLLCMGTQSPSLSPMVVIKVLDVNVLLSLMSRPCVSMNERGVCLCLDNISITHKCRMSPSHRHHYRIHS